MSDWTGNTHSVHSTNGSRHLAVAEREQHDYYATEPKATELLLELDTFSDVWECACGGGHMAEVLKTHGLLSTASDKYDYGYGNIFDFLTSPFVPDALWDGDIITNPPYAFANQFIEIGISRLCNGRKLALFLPIRYLEGKERKNIFKKYPPKKVWVSSSRLICARNGDFSKTKDSAVCYAWFIWEKGFSGETKLGWFN
ncbi:conjugal transfer protein [Candidatus Termititenax aidoneus]|uniref:Conjugal transfer protein n=1 Tax=Termititenax aidoneus TaxID=2218524 RepID=A0A388T928_TERA1|nr:conjugal transfer protein [Candidatus Termititenax aidoneus]